MSGGSPSPLIMKRGRCRSPGISSKVSTSTTPGTRCLVFLRRCLAIQLQKVGSFPNNLSTTMATTMTATTPTTSCTSGLCENSMERDAPLYWMYDSGYLIFQGFLEANLKCFWNGALMEAMKVLEFQGYIAPGVLLVSGSPCALEVIRAAWARNVLKPPNNYAITVVGDVEDCLVEPISQGQFTPLPEALCWIILDMTASGQAAVMESICSTLEVAFPDIQKPSKQLIYDTLAKLMAEKKLYQTSNGYYVMTPDKMRLSGLTTNKKDSCDTFSGSHQKQILLTPEEAVVMMHGGIETVRDGNVTHQAIQTNLADVICGGNPKDKVLHPRIPARIRSGYSAERLERRHSLRFFGHGRRSHSLQRTGSVRHISDKNEKVHLSKEVSPDEVSRKHTSLFSRLFRRSGRIRRDDSPSSSIRPTFSAQFPPPEWFNRGVTHLHSVGTQTTYLAPSTDTLPKRNFNYDSDEIAFHDLQQHRKRISTLGTPRTIRRTSHHSSATLPRRSLKKISSPTTYNGLTTSSCDKDTTTTTSPISRISSQNSVTSPTTITSHNDVPCSSSTPCSGGSHSSLGSSKTVISKEQQHSSKRTSPTHKSMSSASSGYNSLPRSVSGGSVRHSKHGSSKSHSTAATATTSSRANKSSSSSRSKERCTTTENSITFHMSAKSSSSSSSTGCETAAAVNSSVSGSAATTTNANTSGSGSISATTKTERSATTMTINGGNKTKIFVQQQHHNTPTRSLITFENSVVDKHDTDPAADIIIVNQPNECNKNGSCGGETKESKPIRPNSLYVQQNNLGRKSHRYNNSKQTTSSRLLETQLKTKYPSSETIQQEENLPVPNTPLKPNNRKSNVNVLDDLRTTSKDATKFAFGSETELNNAKNYLLSQNSSNLDKINNLRHKNVLTKSVKDDCDSINSEPTSPIIEHHVCKLNDVKKQSRKDFNVEKALENLSVDDSKLKHYTQFPSLSDLSLRFTSLAAQSILKGVSYNSVDTLVEVNMAAEKKRNCEMNISTDLGVV